MAQNLDSHSQIGRLLKLRDLLVFFTVVQHGSMAKAASQLGISQPSVSEVIAQLEHTLGARLFDRRPRGVEPTMYGEALLARTRAVFDELRQGVKDIEFLADPAGGEIRIGCTVTASATFMRSVIHGFSEAFPGVVLRVVDVPAGTYSGLHERMYDLLLEWHVLPSSAVLGDEVSVEFLFDDRLVVVAGPHTRWARRRKVDLADLVDERWILGTPNVTSHTELAAAFRARGLAMPKVALESLSVPLRHYLLTNGQFVGAMPRSIALQLSVKILPIDLPARPWRFAIFTLKNRTVSPVVDRFIAHLRDFAKSISSEHYRLQTAAPND